jgi:hypothetical protein
MRRVTVPPMLAALVSTALASVDGMVFARHGPCPYCGGSLSGYDAKRRRFAVLIEEDTHRQIVVQVLRFRCRSCQRISSAQAPFYPDTRYGGPVVDLCVVLGKRYPFSRVARILDALGVHVDRGTVRNYAARDFGTVPFTEIFRIPVPMSVLRLSALVSEKEASVTGAVLLPALSGVPAAGAAHRPPFRKQGDERDRKNHEKERVPPTQE